MINLPKLTDLEVSNKKILVRADLDVGEAMKEGDAAKLLTNKETIEYLLGKNAKVILIGHRGRPDGKIDGNLSLFEVSKKLSELINTNIDFVYDIAGHEAQEKVNSTPEGSVLCIENLRFDPREESNDDSFSKQLSRLGDVYINEAFSSSAKAHCSIVGIPKYLPHAFGLHFLKEIENLNKVLNNPKRPVVVIISGVKEDKLSYATPFSMFADKVLIAGLLPDFLKLEKVMLDPSIPAEKIVIANLIQDKEDITLHSAEQFGEILANAGTIVVGGPVGKYEDEGHRQGTIKVLEAVAANSSAFKVAGGGDTEQAIDMLGFKEKFDWVSVGGGAMLDFLAKGTLPGIDLK